MRTLTLAVSSFLAGIALVVACGEVPTSHADTPDAGTSTPTDGVVKQGTRIKVRLTTTADGASAPVGFFDSKLGVACSPVPMNDGTTRCTPLSISYSTVSWYGDADCKNRVIASSCSTASFVREAGTGAQQCNTTFQVFKIAGPAKAGSIYRVIDGTCTKYEAGDPDGKFVLGDELPPSEFVEMTTSP